MQKIHLQWLTLTILRLLGRVSIQLLLGCLCLILLSACQGKPLPVGPSVDRDEDLGPPGSDRETDPNPPPVKAFKVRINEVMVSNTDILTNPTGGAWIELYNPTDEPVDLSGLPLSDDLLKANRWLIPRSSEAVISPRGYLVIFCDGDPNRVGGLHSNFALQPGSLTIILNKGSDLFFFDATLLGKGRSAGRAPDGAQTIRVLATPTPGAPNSPAEGVFIRGDANGDGRVNITDMTITLAFLFQSQPAPDCLDQFDSDDDGKVDIADALRIGEALYLHGPPLAPPFPSAGTDPTADGLKCEAASGQDPA